MNPSKTTIPNSKTLFSWAFYDFANTIFSAIVLTSYFPLYLTEITGKNIYLGAVTTGAMILAALVIPFLGALSDQTGKTKSYLIRTTILTVGFLFCFSFSTNPSVLIMLFLIACFFYHASLVFYNSLLPVAAPPKRQGFASGVGTGLGYLGVVCVLPAMHIVDQTLGRQAVFASAAFFFLIASLPLFLFVPERKQPHAKKFRWGLWKIEWQRIIETLKGLPKTPEILLFFTGNFFVVDALNSMIFWFLVYAREVFHPAQNELILILAGVNASAFVAGILTGFLTDRLGALKTMIISSFTLAVSLILLMLSPSFLIFVTVAVSGGAFAIAGIWTSGRKVLVEFSPKDKLGEYFGFYGLTTKISVAGSLLFSIVADLRGFRDALWVLIIPASAGCLMLFASKLMVKKLHLSTRHH